MSFYRANTGATHNICNLKNSVPKKNPIVLHNGSNYDYHLLIKYLAEGFKRKFTCLGQNTEKYITLTVSTEQEVTRIDKKGEVITKNIFYKLQFIESTRFMARSLSNLLNNHSKEIHIIKCNCEYEHEKCETCGIKYNYCDCLF